LIHPSAQDIKPGRRRFRNELGLEDDGAGGTKLGVMCDGGKWLEEASKHISLGTMLIGVGFESISPTEDKGVGPLFFFLGILEGSR